MKIPKISRKEIITASSAIIAICAIAFAYTCYDYVTTYNAQQKKIIESKTFVLQAEAQSTKDLAIILHKKIIRAILLATLIIFLLSIMLSKAYTGNKRSFWLLAIFFSLLLAIDIVVIWYFEVRLSGLKMQSNVIENDADVEKFFAVHKSQNPKIYEEDFHYIPVGFLWYSITINEKIQGDIGDVRLYAYPWATYDLSTDKAIKQLIDKDPNNGVFIAMNSINETRWALSGITQGNKYVLNWQESIALHPDFNYTKYPFDQQQIILNFEHYESLKRITLLPDFEAYKPATTKYPPIDKNINLSGWKITNAYFCYVLSDYSTNFGIQNYWQVKNYPFLTYVIQIQRNFAEPLVTGLLPIIIILFIIFASLLILSKVPNPKDTINGILALLSSLFFANLVSYQTLQNAIMSPNMIYFKLFYIIMYVIIFAATTNCLLYVYRPNSFLNYDNNFIARLLYWPIVMIIFFVITLIFF